MALHTLTFNDLTVADHRKEFREGLKMFLLNTQYLDAISSVSHTLMYSDNLMISNVPSKEKLSSESIFSSGRRCPNVFAK